MSRVAANPVSKNFSILEFTQFIKFSKKAQVEFFWRKYLSRNEFRKVRLSFLVGCKMYAFGANN
jgi:hypothetical protein